MAIADNLARDQGASPACSRKFDRRHVRLVGELILVFGGLPLAYAAGWIPLPMILTLVLAAVAAAAVLWRDPAFPRRQLWNWSAAGPAMRPARSLAIFLTAAALMTLAVAVFAPERLFGFMRAKPAWWLAVMLLYPLLSVYPQEIICRAFLHHRYRELFPRPAARVWVSAVAFAFLHIVFRNWPAVLLSLPGGWLFARTYERTGSLSWTSLEHAVYGNWVFTVGLGIYFYGRASTGG